MSYQNVYQILTAEFMAGFYRITANEPRAMKIPKYTLTIIYLSNFVDKHNASAFIVINWYLGHISFLRPTEENNVKPITICPNDLRWLFFEYCVQHNSRLQVVNGTKYLF